MVDTVVIAVFPPLQVGLVRWPLEWFDVAHFVMLSLAKVGRVRD